MKEKKQKELNSGDRLPFSLEYTVFSTFHFVPHFFLLGALTYELL